MIHWVKMSGIGLRAFGLRLSTGSSSWRGVGVWGHSFLMVYECEFLKRGALRTPKDYDGVLVWDSSLGFNRD